MFFWVVYPKVKVREEKYQYDEHVAVGLQLLESLSLHVPSSPGIFFSFIQIFPFQYNISFFWVIWNFVASSINIYFFSNQHDINFK